LEATSQRLKQDIQDGVYTPRQHLVETDVAKALGVSCATLRAALIRLHHEGFVEIQPNRGAQVRSFNFLAYLPLVGRFHQVIVAAADNEFIHQCLGMLQAPLIRHQFRIILVPGRKDESLAEHRDILIAMEQRDAVGAEQAMQRHVAQLCHALQHASRLPIG
jgi:DNA-binding GntR family transcriptional regulator